jgi:hypothetical protein
LSILDSLQDLDLVSIPNLILKSNANEAELIDVNNLINSINVTNTNMTSSINTNTNSINALVSADLIHDTQLNSLIAQDIVLQNNIDLKNEIISSSNKLSSSLLFDSVQNDTLDNIIATIDTNITTLSTDKQDNINGINKLNSLYIDMNTTALQYVDVTAPLKAQITAINSAISTLQGITSNDTISTFQNIEDNFDLLEANKVDLTVYTPQITNILETLTTLGALQNGDLVSFANINTSLDLLTNGKQPLINSENELSSLLL